VHADNAKLHPAKVTRVFYNDKSLRISVQPPYSPDLAPSDFSSLGISKTASKESNSGQHMHSFRESDKFWTKSALRLWKRFSGSESADWTDALQQMENTWNEANNGSLKYS
jgi:hypothetical protein